MTGGARIGWMNATWPLARLSASPDNLTITVRMLGTYSFSPDQVLSVERYVMIPVFGWGIQVHHCVADYPRRIIFWCLGSPDTILRGIRDSGFQPSGSTSAVPKRSGIPVRWSAIIAVIVGWNALLLLDFACSKGIPSYPGPLACLALLLVFVLSIGTLTSPTLQRLILKPDRRVGEIRPLLRLLAFISGAMLVIFSILLASGAFYQHT